MVSPKKPVFFSFALFFLLFLATPVLSQGAGCGDGYCSMQENNFSCSQDCFCGNKVCELRNLENHASCPEDCGSAPEYHLETRACIAIQKNHSDVSLDDIVLPENYSRFGIELDGLYCSEGTQEGYVLRCVPVVTGYALFYRYEGTPIMCFPGSDPLVLRFWNGEQFEDPLARLISRIIEFLFGIERKPACENSVYNPPCRAGETLKAFGPPWPDYLPVGSAKPVLEHCGNKNDSIGMPLAGLYVTIGKKQEKCVIDTLACLPTKEKKPGYSFSEQTVCEQAGCSVSRVNSSRENVCSENFFCSCNEANKCSQTELCQKALEGKISSKIKVSTIDIQLGRTGKNFVSGETVPYTAGISYERPLAPDSKTFKISLPETGDFFVTETDSGCCTSYFEGKTTTREGLFSISSSGQATGKICSNPRKAVKFSLEEFSKETTGSFASGITHITDLDNDKTIDLAVSDPGQENPDGSTGTVFVSFMEINGTPKGFTSIFSPTGKAFGSSLGFLGSLGQNDSKALLVGDPKDSDGGNERGAVYIVGINSLGNTVSMHKISSLSGNFSASLKDFDNFGASASAIGDLDRDNIPDIVVGSPKDDEQTTDAGAAYVLFLKKDGTVKGHRKIAGIKSGFSAKLSPQDYFGSSVASLGDIDGDNVPDIAVGAPGDDSKGPRKGAVYVLFLNSDGAVKSYKKLASGESGLPVLIDNIQFGFSLSGLSDLDGDKKTELAVGMPGDSNGGTVMILFLDSNGSVREAQKISAKDSVFAPQTIENLGLSVSFVPDLDADSTIDILIASKQSAWILFLGECQKNK